MNNQLDCRGLVCPLPVIETKKALVGLAGATLTVLVDNQTAKENVVKFASSQQCGVSVEPQADGFCIQITKPVKPAEPAAPASVPSGGMVCLITQDSLGHGNRELGSVLMKSFFYTLTEQELPSKILFLNSGVLLTLQDSAVLGHIKALANSGVEVLSCGTCLDYYGVKEKLAVGGVTNKYTIVEALSTGRAVTL